MSEAFKTLRTATRMLALAVARGWLGIALTALGIYISLPWAAPVLAKTGLHQPADLIYTLYSPFCHQFAFRSPFLFGEQAFYPRAIADSAYQPFELYAADSAAFGEQFRYWTAAFGGGQASVEPSQDALLDYSPAQQFAARHFIGDATMGYKTTLCARDLAIYSMLFVGGLIYRRYRWRIRPLPFWLFLVAGVGPIAIDGFSQLLGYPPFDLWQPRETQPLFRFLTGGVFGLMSAWLAFPHMDRSMQDIAESLEDTS